MSAAPCAACTAAGLTEALLAGTQLGARAGCRSSSSPCSLPCGQPCKTFACRDTPGREGKGEGDLERMGCPVIWA